MPWKGAMTEEEAGVLFDRVDSDGDGDGVITMQEWMQSPQRPAGPRDPISNFLNADRDRDKTISREEFLQYNRQFGRR